MRLPPPLTTPSTRQCAPNEGARRDGEVVGADFQHGVAGREAGIGMGEEWCAQACALRGAETDPFVPAISTGLGGHPDWIALAHDRKQPC